MTASPALLSLMIPGESLSPPGPAVVASAEFGQALGAALASILSGVSPLGGVQPAVEPALPSLDLTFEVETTEADGGVVTEVGDEPLVQPAGFDDGAPAPSPLVAEPLSLERGLDLWLGRLVANAGSRPARQPVGAGAEPNEGPVPSRPCRIETGYGIEVQLAAEPEATPAPVGVVGAPPVAPPPVAAVEPGVVPEPKPAPSPVPSPIEMAPRQPIHREPPRRQPEPFEERPHALDLDQGVSVAVLLGRRAALESIIEIAGFGFPAAPTASRPESIASRPAPDPMLPATESQLTPAGELPVVARKSGFVSELPPRFGEIIPTEQAVHLGAKKSPAAVPGLVETADRGADSATALIVAAVAHRASRPPEPAAPLTDQVTRATATLPAIVAATVDSEPQARSDHEPDARSPGNPKPRSRPEESFRPSGPDPAPVEPLRPGLGAAPAPTTARSGGSTVAAAPVTLSTTLQPEPPVAPRREEVVLRLGDDQTDVGRLRVSINGPHVRATIIPTDPDLAAQLTVNLRELRQSLEDRGFPEPRVTIQSPRPLEAPGVIARDLVIEAQASAETKTGPRQSATDDRRDRGSEPPPRHEQRHRSPDRSRQHDQEEEPHR